MRNMAEFLMKLPPGAEVNREALVRTNLQTTKLVGVFYRKVQHLIY